jgi:hypothetical protein
METVELRMTWTGVLPMLLTVLECGDEKGRQFALEELARMARAADITLAKEEEESK